LFSQWNLDGRPTSLPLRGLHSPSAQPAHPASIAITWKRRRERLVLIDTGPDFGSALRGHPHVDAVFYTHAHADHISDLMIAALSFEHKPRRCRSTWTSRRRRFCGGVRIHVSENATYPTRAASSCEPGRCADSRGARSHFQRVPLTMATAGCGFRFGSARYLTT